MQTRLNGYVHIVSAQSLQVIVPSRTGARPEFFTLPVQIAERLAEGDYIEFTASFSAEEQPDIVTEIHSVNGFVGDAIYQRPTARSRRSQWERTRPDMWLSLANSITGRAIDFAAPLPAGAAGVITGQHGTGLSYSAATIAEGALQNQPDIHVFWLLTSRRAEEHTALRRKFPQATIVVCPAVSPETPASVAQLVPRMMLSAACRYSETGRDALLLIDSLTDLWYLMLQEEQAGDQMEADHSGARHRIREFLQHAGCFHGNTPLGGGCGGSLTIIGTVWDKPVDEAVEQDRELHPALRLLEYAHSDINWRLALSSSLASNRVFPSIDLANSYAHDEEAILPADIYRTIGAARQSLLTNGPDAALLRLVDKLDEYSSLSDLCASLAGPSKPSSARKSWDQLWGDNTDTPDAE